MAVIAIDLDHTLVNGKERLPYSKEAINLFREKGHKIVIHSCNSPEWIVKVLNDNDIRYDTVWSRPGKPLCDMYIDDKGYRFQGDWKTEVHTVLDLVKDLDNRKWPL